MCHKAYFFYTLQTLALRQAQTNSSPERVVVRTCTCTCVCARAMRFGGGALVDELSVLLHF